MEADRHTPTIREEFAAIDDEKIKILERRLQIEVAMEQGLEVRLEEPVIQAILNMTPSDLADVANDVDRGLLLPTELSKFSQDNANAALRVVLSELGSDSEEVLMAELAEFNGWTPTTQ